MEAQETADARIWSKNTRTAGETQQGEQHLRGKRNCHCFRLDPALVMIFCSRFFVYAMMFSAVIERPFKFPGHHYLTEPSRNSKRH